MDAYMEGLESFKGDDLSKITNVASFFVSRVDTLVDKKLEKIGTDDALALRGKAATAQAVLAFKLYQENFSGPRWEALEKRGARVLWASTSVKKTIQHIQIHYMLILRLAPKLSQIMSDLALQAFMDHGKVSRKTDNKLPNNCNWKTCSDFPI